MHHIGPRNDPSVPRNHLNAVERPVAGGQLDPFDAPIVNERRFLVPELEHTGINPRLTLRSSRVYRKRGGIGWHMGDTQRSSRKLRHPIHLIP
jgi:hypothetical protein